MYFVDLIDSSFIGMAIGFGLAFFCLWLYYRKER